MKTCICDKCGKEIEITVKEETIDKNITEQFFVCPKCDQRYTIFISDSFMRQKIKARMRLKKNPKLYNPELDASLVREMQKHFEELKIKYGR